jgi:hypothetical protein
VVKSLAFSDPRKLQAGLSSWIVRVGAEGAPSAALVDAVAGRAS